MSPQLLRHVTGRPPRKLAYLDDSTRIPYDDLRYVFGEIMYGGHITDPWDRRTNNTYLRVLFNEGLFAGADLALGEGFPEKCGPSQQLDATGHSVWQGSRRQRCRDGAEALADLWSGCLSAL